MAETQFDKLKGMDCYNVNLDAMSLNDLCTFARESSILSNYAIEKSAALIARQGGDIQAALQHERRCDALYFMLPAHMRW